MYLEGLCLEAHLISRGQNISPRCASALPQCGIHFPRTKAAEKWPGHHQLRKDIPLNG